LLFPSASTFTEIADTGYEPEGTGEVEGGVACGLTTCNLDGITFRAES
jgi:hypothetical protein